MAVQPGTVAAEVLEPSAGAAAVAVVVPADLAGPVWRLLRAEVARRGVDGGRVRPGVARLLEELRAAALAHVITSGQDRRSSADMGASSEYVSTARVAELLGVTDRHARRLLTDAGYRQARRGVWRAADAAAMVAARRR